MKSEPHLLIINSRKQKFVKNFFRNFLDSLICMPILSRIIKKREMKNIIHLPHMNIVYGKQVNKIISLFLLFLFCFLLLCFCHLLSPPISHLSITVFTIAKRKNLSRQIVLFKALAKKDYLKLSYEIKSIVTNFNFSGSYGSTRIFL